MDRPALEKLLADIHAGKIDTVVVYKVDRLTRSLSDFARIVDVFDAHGVSFVSVTQSFNTTTSMGRLTLNMLLSFAQFEREVTGERIRDKIAASKQKGMWMGGMVPLGYDADGRTLTINEDEAKTVRTLFELYSRLGNVRLVKHEADRIGLRTKIRKTERKNQGGGKPFARGQIYKLLSNPIYVGRIPHRDQSYPGLHQAIIDNGTWDKVQALLSNNAPRRPRHNHIAEPSALAGKLFDETGTPLTPTHSAKSGRRYRYYVSRHLVTGDRSRDLPNGDGEPGLTDRRSGWRLPAHEIERIVASAVADLIADKSALVTTARQAGLSAEHVPQLLDAAVRSSSDPLVPVERVDLLTNALTIVVDIGRFLGNAPTPSLRLHLPLTMKRRGVEMRLVIEGPNDKKRPTRADPALVKLIVRARKWFDMLASGKVKSIAEMAAAENLGDSYVSHALPLAFLAPDIIEAILAGTQPVSLTAEALLKRIDLPLDWTEQRRILGFDSRTAASDH